MIVKVTGESNVTVVIANHVEVFSRELGAEFVVLGGHLSAKSHHQEKRRVARTAKSVISDADAVGVYFHTRSLVV